jgi:hypothetical protein
LNHIEEGYLIKDSPPAVVREAVFRVARILAPHRTGMLIAPSHRIMADKHDGTVDPLLDAFTALRLYQEAIA